MKKQIIIFYNSSSIGSIYDLEVRLILITQYRVFLNELTNETTVMRGFRFRLATKRMLTLIFINLPDFEQNQKKLPNYYFEYSTQ